MSPPARHIPLQEEQPGAIAPELLANKMAALRRLQLPDFQKALEKQPRLIEAYWHIQHVSTQPGGLGKFVKEFLGVIQLGTPSMRKFGRRKYTPAECLAVWHEIDGEVRDAIDRDIADECGLKNVPTDEWLDPDEFSQAQRAEIIQKWDKARTKFLHESNEPLFMASCNEAAEFGLVRFLERACGSREHQDGEWYSPDVFAQLIQFIDRRAQQIRQRLAPTAVVEKVFDALDYAGAERVMVRISGESRFGKTEAVETWAEMWPGRARVVRTPSSNSERDLLKAFAEAFGIQHGYGVNAQNLKDKVEYVIRFGGLMVILDEGAFLVPSHFSAVTPPARLNWIRTSIVDRKVPCVIVVTPQSYGTALARFVKKTNYSIEQFLGREALRVDLPDELSREDLLAVARVHFPEADEDLLGLIVGKAMQSESYLKAVENIAKRARYIAKKRGAKKLSLRDVDTAIAEVMPAPAAAPAPAPKPHTAAKRQTRRSRAAEVLQAPFKSSASQFPARETVPLRDSPEVALALATG